MEHPILFINLLLEKLGVHVPGPGQMHTFTDYLLQPHITYAWVVIAGARVPESPWRPRASRWSPPVGRTFSRWLSPG